MTTCLPMNWCQWVSSAVLVTSSGVPNEAKGLCFQKLSQAGKWFLHSALQNVLKGLVACTLCSETPTLWQVLWALKSCPIMHNTAFSFDWTSFCKLCYPLRDVNVSPPFYSHGKKLNISSISSIVQLFGGLPCFVFIINKRDKMLKN